MSNRCSSSEVLKRTSTEPDAIVLDDSSESETEQRVEKLRKADDDDFEVDFIVDLAVEDGQELFRVRWKGYLPEDDTWEPESHFLDPNLVRAYRRSTSSSASGVAECLSEKEDKDSDDDEARRKRCNQVKASFSTCPHGRKKSGYVSAKQSAGPPVFGLRRFPPTKDRRAPATLPAEGDGQDDLHSPAGTESGMFVLRESENRSGSASKRRLARRLRPRPRLRRTTARSTQSSSVHTWMHA